jgi:hypothetical protein
MLSVKFIYLLTPQKQLVSIIEGLCKGHGCLDRTDIVAFTALLKCANIPSRLEALTEEKNEPEEVLFHNGAFFQTLQMAYTTSEEEPSSCRDHTPR